jgi:hypothetical protein
VVVRRHVDADLLTLARDGSSAAYAALLHRHRGVLQRGVGEAADPERAAGTVMVQLMRDLRSGDLEDRDVPTRIDTAARAVAASAPRTAGVEPLLPSDWFDRAWTTAERSWPHGRRPLPRPPRWAVRVTAGLALAALGAGGTWLVLERDGDREIIGSIVASVLDGPTALDGVPPPPEPVVEDPPALFGDIEIGELPTYDLTRPEPARDTAGPEVAPPRP